MGSEQENVETTSTTPKTYESVAPKAQREILVHAVLAGLTPLIPLPFVDGWARKGIQTRMVRRIAKAHDKRLYDSDAKALGKERGRDQSLLFATTKKLIFFPIKRIFRTTLFFLVVKDIVEIASRTYHVGYLLDFGIGEGLYLTTSPEVLREAVDDVCRKADTSPVRRAFLSVFEGSRDLLGAAMQSLRAWMNRSKQQEDADLEDSPPPKEVETLADRLQRAINILPPEHFEKLRQELRTTLGVEKP